MSLVAAAGILWSCSRSGDEAPVSTEDERLALLSEVSDFVLPETEDGPAASAVGVPQFLLLALEHHLADTDVPATPEQSDYVAWLEGELNVRTGGRFLGAAEAQKEQAVADMDAAAFRDRSAPTPWLKLKQLILIGYYTSETGGSDVLRYEPVPGEFTGDVDIEPGMKALSNDWTGVKYG